MNQSQPRCSGSNLPFMMIITELYRVCRSQPCANTLPELLLSENGIIQLTVTLAARLADASYEATNGRWNDARHRYGFKIKKIGEPLVAKKPKKAPVEIVRPKQN